MGTRRANLHAALTGLIAALITFFVGWAVVRLVLLAMVATLGVTPFAAGGLPATAALLAVAAVVGWLVAARRRPAAHQVRTYRVLAMRATAAVAGAAILVGGWLGGWWTAEHLQEPNYLNAFEDSDYETTGDDVLLTAGHRACDWLQAKRWGSPPDGPSDIVHTGDWSYNPRTSSNSTRRLLASYAEEVGSRDLRLASPEEQLLILSAEPAWHRLCPASQFIRRPAGPFNAYGSD